MRSEPRLVGHPLGIAGPAGDWDFEFRRFVLRDGWQQDEWNYDQYIVQDERKTTHDPKAFEDALGAWVPAADALQHMTDSSCPE